MEQTQQFSSSLPTGTLQVQNPSVVSPNSISNRNSNNDINIGGLVNTTGRPEEEVSTEDILQTVAAQPQPNGTNINESSTSKENNAPENSSIPADSQSQQESQRYTFFQSRGN